MAATSAQYSLTIRVEIDHKPGMLGRVASAIGGAGGVIGAIDLISVDDAHTLRDITVDASDQSHWAAIVEAIGPSTAPRSSTRPTAPSCCTSAARSSSTTRCPLKTRDDLSMAYTPGVARVCEAIAEDPAKAFQYTIKRNTVAVVSDGTAVLGLGDIGPEAAMPVMEGKAMLFKEFAGIDAFPICLDTKDVDEIVATVKAIAPTFGGINLEDISAPRCFEIEDRLKAELDIPVFHDDQHGTAVVVLAALLNACKIVDKRLEDLRVVVVGLGRRRRRGHQDPAGRRRAPTSSAATRKGALSIDRADYVDGSMNADQALVRRAHEPRAARRARPADVIDGADLFIGLSGPRVMPAEALARMAKDAMVFAMANPTPEVTPEEAAPLRPDHGHRPLGLPQPDQQRARLPRHLPRRPRRPRAARSPRR